MKPSNAPISETVEKVVQKELSLLRQLRDGEISRGMFAKRWPCTRHQVREFLTLVDEVLPVAESDSNL